VINAATAAAAAAGNALMYGELRQPFQLVWSQYMSWDAYHWSFDESPGYPGPEGCVFAVELQGELAFDDFPPHLASAPPAPQMINDIRAAVDGETGDVMSYHMSGYPSTPGTPYPTRAPPAGAWPTTAPIELVEPPDLIGRPGRPTPTPDPEMAHLLEATATP
jgi:hypothetical protein